METTTFLCFFARITASKISCEAAAEPPGLLTRRRMAFTVGSSLALFSSFTMSSEPALTPPKGEAEPVELMTPST